MSFGLFSGEAKRGQGRGDTVSPLGLRQPGGSSSRRACNAGKGRAGGRLTDSLSRGESHERKRDQTSCGGPCSLHCLLPCLVVCAGKVIIGSACRGVLPKRRRRRRHRTLPAAALKARRDH